MLTELQTPFQYSVPFLLVNANSMRRVIKKAMFSLILKKSKLPSFLQGFGKMKFNARFGTGTNYARKAGVPPLPPTPKKVNCNPGSTGFYFALSTIGESTFPKRYPFPLCCYVWSDRVFAWCVYARALSLHIMTMMFWRVMCYSRDAVTSGVMHFYVCVIPFGVAFQQNRMAILPFNFHLNRHFRLFTFDLMNLQRIEHCYTCIIDPFDYWCWYSSVNAWWKRLIQIYNKCLFEHDCMNWF